MLKKQYVKSRQVWKVTFDLPEAEMPPDIGVESVHLVGEFNDWDATATPMVRRRGGVYRSMVELPPGRDYQFRYVINGELWCNDWHADAYVPTGYGEDNCVVTAPSPTDA
jgi:1,4-alpha-glucan branching enzyme